MTHERSIESLKRTEFKDFISFFKTEIVSRQIAEASCNGITDKTKRMKCTYENIHINKKYDDKYVVVLNETCR